jgi:hypothetical protein
VPPPLPLLLTANGAVTSLQASTMGTTALLDLLDQAAVAYQSVPLWLLVTGHCLSVVTLFRGYSPFWLVGWLVGFIACFGGGTSSALLLQVGFVTLCAMSI